VTSLRARTKRGGGPGVNTNGKNHSDRVGEDGKIRAYALRLECESLVAERHNLNLEAYSVEGALKRKSSLKKLEKGALQNCD
jgi:hypothetical protein